jgi:peroxiredoxin
MSTMTRRSSDRLTFLATLLFSMLALIACADESGDGASRSASSTSSTLAAGAANADPGSERAAHAARPSGGKPEPETAPRNPNERPIPAFKGRTLAGTSLSVSEMLGSRLVILIVNPEVPFAQPVAEAVQRIAALRGDQNFQILGVGVGSNRQALMRFAQENELDFPILDDSGGTISQTLRLRAPVAILGADAEGFMTFGIGNFPQEGDVAGLVEADLRESLRLPEAPGADDGALIEYTKAPALSLKAMSSGEVVETGDLAGRAAVVIFFLHTCPHCHKALAALESIFASIQEDKRPRLIAVSIQNNPSSIRSSLEELDLDYFDPYLDPGQAATERWGVTGGVPVVFVLDAEGNIRHRSTGWDEKRDAAMIRMKLARAAGVQVPMLLDPKGYSGNDVCGVCHEQEHATWQFTKHATAYDTLVTHNADRRTDCVGCHVVGFEQPGGFDFAQHPTYLENVGCESCHGRGGPHLSPGFVPETGYAEVCSTCHNPTHSLGFDYATFHPRISHEAIAAMSPGDRSEILGGAGPNRDLLGTHAEYVGSNACQSCHQAEFKTWAASPHGHAIASLEKQGEAANTECLVCHTTGFGKPGGFPSDAVVANQPDLARVGCESCHGPGSEHVGESAERIGTILSLGDKCDSCVILKVCGTCHDDANDPGFQFKVEERIDAQRHGTIESAATRQGKSAALPHHTLLPAGSVAMEAHDRVILRDAFERLARNEDVGMTPSGAKETVDPDDRRATADPS